MPGAFSTSVSLCSESRTRHSHVSSCVTHLVTHPRVSLCFVNTNNKHLLVGKSLSEVFKIVFSLHVMASRFVKGCKGDIMHFNKTYPHPYPHHTSTSLTVTTPQVENLNLAPTLINHSPGLRSLILPPQPFPPFPGHPNLSITTECMMVSIILQGILYLLSHHLVRTLDTRSRTCK